jgi:DNA-binding transcriptional LysR family regulator
MDLEWIRSYLVVIEEGSLNAAANRLGVAQSSLTRRLQALEQELGGTLLERSPRGIAPTAAGQDFAREMAGVLAAFDAGVGAVRQRLRGQTSLFRVGYLLSAATTFVNPALARVRARHPETRVQLLDQSPGEQLAALRAGMLDFALLGHLGEDLSGEFHVRRLARLGLVLAAGEQHPLAAHAGCRLADLAGEVFVGVPERDMPGYRPWVTRLCREAGFRPRFGPPAESLSEGLSQVVLEDTVLLLGDYARALVVPGVRFLPVLDAPAEWDLLVAWPRGRTPPVVQTMVEALTAAAREALGPAPGRRE